MVCEKEGSVRPFGLLEYIGKVDLQQRRIAEGGTLPPEVVRSVAVSVLRALAYLHQCGPVAVAANAI